MKILRRFFGYNPTPGPIVESPFKLTDPETASIGEFKQLQENDRIRQMMTTGNSGDAAFFALIRYGIFEDANIHVRSAALKRIHLFGHHPETIPLLQTLKDKPLDESMEPYLSMALHRLQLIGKEELDKRINAARYPGREKQVV